MTTVAIVQSNYIPWRGYFDLIAAADVFVVYDSVQYTKRDWRNRNRIKTPAGTRWLTVPVQGSQEQSVDVTPVADRDALRKHWSTIRQSYAGAPCFGSMRDEIEPWFDRQAPELLTDLNVDLITRFCGLLGIDTDIRRDREFELVDDRSGRLLEICRQLGADTYLSGPAAREYLDVTMFGDAGVEVSWMDYSGYPEYQQPHPPFDPAVSIVDLVLCTGGDAPSYMKHRTASGS